MNAKTRKHLKEKVPIHKYLQGVHRKRQNSVGENWALMVFTKKKKQEKRCVCYFFGTLVSLIVVCNYITSGLTQSTNVLSNNKKKNLYIYLKGDSIKTWKKKP